MSEVLFFLDPDTGLEPAGAASHSHILKTELRSIWNEMPSGWILVFYQHKKNRNSQEWIEPKQKQFAETINMPLADVHIASGYKITKDVLFFFAVKNNMAGNARPTLLIKSIIN